MPARKVPDYYALLEVPPDADPETIRASHKRLLKKLHPDRNPHVDPSQVAVLNAAYEVLADPQKRADYDASRRTGHSRHMRQRQNGERETQWPDGFDIAEQTRRQARMEAQYRRAQEQRAEDARRKAAEETAERERRRQELLRDREEAAKRLAELRSKLEREKVDEEALARKAERDRKSQLAEEIAKKVSRSRSARLTQRTRVNRRAVPNSFTPIDRFTAKIWLALSDRELIFTDRPLHPAAQGTWDVHNEGIRWRSVGGTEVFIPAGEIDWASRQLFRNGYLPRLSMLDRLGNPNRLGREGWPIAKGLFSLLSRLPFFTVEENPLSLHFDRATWEPLLGE